MSTLSSGQNQFLVFYRAKIDYNISSNEKNWQTMIEYVRGKLASKSLSAAVIECGGIGYFITISEFTYRALPEVGQEVKLWTHLVHHENAMELYGFATPLERELFRYFISVSRIGPKVAVAMLSGEEPQKLLSIIKRGDVDALARIPKIGPKTARRIIGELKDKIVTETEPGPTPQNDAAQEAIGALEALGFTHSEAVSAVAKAQKIAPDATVEELIKLALSSK